MALLSMLCSMQIDLKYLSSACSICKSMMYAACIIWSVVISSACQSYVWFEGRAINCCVDVNSFLYIAACHTPRGLRATDRSTALYSQTKMDGKAEKYGVQPIVEKAGINCVSSCSRSVILLKSFFGILTQGFYDGQVEFQNHMTKWFHYTVITQFGMVLSYSLL